MVNKPFNFQSSVAKHLPLMPPRAFRRRLGRSTMMQNRADECRQRDDECRRNAAQLVSDDVLRGAYLDLARLWRSMAHQAQQKELGSNSDTAPSLRANRRLGYSPVIIRSTARIAQGINKLSASAALNPRTPQTANGNIPDET